MGMEEWTDAYLAIISKDEEIAPIPEPLDDFDAWVANQTIPETKFFCYLEIHNEWINGYNLFAGHDCEIYDLHLTIMARRTDWDEHLESISSDVHELGCNDIGTLDRACKYSITPGNNKLGIRFDSSADVDLYYETEWIHTVKNMNTE